MQLAKEYVGQTGQLYVILNSDAQAIQKRGYCAVPMRDRKAIVSAIRYVDKVFDSVDTDRTVCKTLEYIYVTEADPECQICFLNSGDRSSEEVPEGRICHMYGIDMVDLPAPKVNSSSDMIKNIVANQHLLKW